jgi:hypothetical protein
MSGPFIHGRCLRTVHAARNGFAFPNNRLAQQETYFMRRVTALCAASAIALSAIATVSPAQAAFHIIKWGGNNLCQVWDESVPTKPWPDNYKAVSKPVASFDAAVAVKAHLTKKGVCKI